MSHQSRLNLAVNSLALRRDGPRGLELRYGAQEPWLPLLPRYDVQQFGAVADGATDVSVAVQEAVDEAVAAGGGEVFFPAGVYRFTAAGIVLTSATDKSFGVTLRGSGARTQLVTSVAIPLITVSSTSAGAGTSRRVIVDNMRLSAGHTGATGVYLSQASYNQFSNLDFDGVGTAIVVGDGTFSTEHTNQFNNIRITAPGRGVICRGDGNQFANLSVTESISGADAINIPTGAEDNVFTNLRVQANGGTGGTACIDVRGAQNMFVNTRIASSYAIGLYIANNRNYFQGLVENTQTHGIVIDGGANNVRLDVSVVNAGLATADTYDSIRITNGVAGLIMARFAGTGALNDINEVAGSANIYIVPTTAPNTLAFATATYAYINSTNFRLPGLPTSSAGLATGQLWNDTGTIKVA